MTRLPLGLALLLLLQTSGAQQVQAPSARREDLHYMRPLQVPAGTGQACALLDAQTFQHAAASLKDLRLFPAGVAGHEIPYATTLSEAVTEETEAARLLNLGKDAGGRIVFDLAMPARAYTSVMLQLDPAAHNFVATATVTGSDTLRGGEPRELGTFTLFDLAAQHLSRNTTLPLEESDLRYLHVALTVTNAGGGSAARKFAPSLVRGAQIPPSREAQILYTPVAETRNVTTAGRETRATFQTPARVPIERISFVLAPDYNGNFSRDVRVTAKADCCTKDSAESEDTRSIYPESISGTIMRVHANEAGREIRTEQLSVPAVLGSNLQHGATVEVTVNNGDDQPLPVTAVRLEMRQRKLCFDPNAAKSISLYYGDDRLEAPVYDYARLFRPARVSLAAQLGPEQPNPLYRPTEERRSFTERHPESIWIALIAVICVLGTVAVRASKNVGL